MIVDRVCNPLRGSAWSRWKNSRFFAILAVPARPSAGCGRCAKTRVFFLAFLRCAHEPSAGIGVVEVQKLKVFANSDLPARPSAGRGPRATTRGLVALSPQRGSCVSPRVTLAAILLLAKRPLWKLSRGSPDVVIARLRVRFLAGARQLRLKPRRRSMWSVLLTAPTGKSQP